VPVRTLSARYCSAHEGVTALGQRLTCSRKPDTYEPVVLFLTATLSGHHEHARFNLGELVSDTRPSWSGRLAAGWDRAWPTVMRLFLVVVFAVGLVAQFVKPVGDLLHDKIYLGGALATVAGYVLYAEVLRLNAAHAARRQAEESLADVVGRLDGEAQRLNSVLRPRTGAVVTPRELERSFQEAIEAGGDVRLTAMGSTGETFAVPLKNVLQGVSRNHLRTVTLRVLVPDFTQRIEVPGLVGGDAKASDAPGSRAHLRRQINEYESSLKYQTGRMALAQRGTLSVEFRVLHMSPSLSTSSTTTWCMRGSTTRSTCAPTRGPPDLLLSGPRRPTGVSWT
jgi:hypothetical protein